MNKGDLISRKALLKELRAELKECRKDADELGGENILWAEGIEFAIDAVKQTTAVDAVEVVRCEDCTYRHDSCFAGAGNTYCDLWHTYFPLDGFCHEGERREGE